MKFLTSLVPILGKALFTMHTNPGSYRDMVELEVPKCTSLAACASI